MSEYLEKFRTLISEYYPLSDDETEYMDRNIPFRVYEKGEMIFTDGQVSDTIYFLLEGSVRMFYNADGIDKTAYFYNAGKFICAGESFTFGIPAVENYQALENKTVLMHFLKPTIENLLKLFPKFELIARYAVEDELITYQKMHASFITKSPEERYKELLKNNSELFLQVPQQYIASYLGISPETLSRIKKRVLLKEQK